jgi:VIT1/CCC1 family predicted Fe2+/Mn2+ transporter|tara:strand:- start:1167 stop:1739 length:573 start_codon:yes stop_codon:yes gene_type:complete
VTTLHPNPKRLCLHKEPKDAYGLLQHYVADLVYGGTDGVLTTFAVVAGITGGALSARAVVIVGLANLLADGLAMGVGNYLSIRARESALERQHQPEVESQPIRHGLATMLAFIGAGIVPLVPYLVPDLSDRFGVAIVCALAVQFGIGAAQTVVTAGRWWISGTIMLCLGSLVALVAYGTGSGVAWILQNE